MAVTVDCMFDTYLHGEENLEVFKCLRSFADNPVGVYYLTGKNSSGKTHLLTAIENHLKNTSFAVARISSNDFKNELLEACKNSRIDEFYKAYGQLDVVLVDDAQYFVTNWDDTLAPLIQLFHQQKKGIICAGDYLSASWRDNQILRVLSLVEPGFETRQQLLQRYLQKKGLLLEDDVAAYVANTLTDVRQLQGFVTLLSAIRSTTPQK